jgi:Secretion system C-terminal sorting domain
VEVLINTSVSALSSSAFTIFPNPSSGALNVRSDRLCSVSIYSMDGRLVWKSTGPGPQHTADLSRMPVGCYLVVCNSNNERKTVQWIKSE